MRTIASVCLAAWFAALLAACNSCCNTCSPCASPCSTPRGTVVYTQAKPVAVSRTTVGASKEAAPKEEASEIWDSLLRTYVRGDYFDYAALKNNARDRARFQRFLDWQGTADVSAMNRNEQIAFYINAYNSLNVKMIVKHYPVHSPIDIPGYFDKIKHPVGGESLTVAEAEYERLIANYKDMRAHFAVVCSDRGCLPLLGRAYAGATLDADLDAAAKKFVADERHFKVDKEKGEVQISKIFEWYGPKFTQDPKLPAEKPELYLMHWVDEDTKAFLESGEYKLKIIEWNWTINEKTNGAASSNDQAATK